MGLLAILMTLIAIGGSFFILFANGMSDSPGTPFQGGWIIAALWLIAAGFAAGWWWG